MPLKLSGWFRVFPSGPATEYVDTARQRILTAIREEQTGVISQSSGTITSRRGYNELPYSSNRLANFDPVEISLRAEDDAILVRYKLGLNPLYFLLAVAAAVTVYFLLISATPLHTSLLVVALPLGIAFGITVFNMWRAHVWLKSVVQSTISKTSPVNNLRLQ